MGIGSRPDPQPFACLLVLKELNAAVCEGLVGETTVFTYHSNLTLETAFFQTWVRSEHYLF